jgi:hypothetical protein
MVFTWDLLFYYNDVALLIPWHPIGCHGSLTGEDFRWIVSFPIFQWALWLWTSSSSFRYGRWLAYTKVFTFVNIVVLFVSRMKFRGRHDYFIGNTFFFWNGRLYRSAVHRVSPFLLSLAVFRIPLIYILTSGVFAADVPLFVLVW